MTETILSTHGVKIGYTTGATRPCPRLGCKGHKLVVNLTMGKQVTLCISHDLIWNELLDGWQLKTPMFAYTTQLPKSSRVWLK